MGKLWFNWSVIYGILKYSTTCRVGIRWDLTIKIGKMKDATMMPSVELIN
jgi:hypothetical protein